MQPGDAGQPITTSFFRNSNLTQYGGKADIVLMGSTGSENTGQASAPPACSHVLRPRGARDVARSRATRSASC